MTNKQALDQIQTWRDLFEANESGERATDTFKRWYSFKIEAIRSTNSDYRLISDLMEKNGADDNTKYEWIVGALDDLIDQLSDEQTLADEFSSDTLQDRIIEYAQNDTPIYNSELCEWMSKGTNWAFVDEAIEEFGATGGVIQLIQMGYAKGLEEMYYSVIDALEGGDSDE